MSWSPDYKKNRMNALDRMKIKDRCNYNTMREYYASINGCSPQISETSPARKLLFRGIRMNLSNTNTASKPNTRQKLTIAGSHNTYEPQRDPNSSPKPRNLTSSFQKRMSG